jgi:hypothetical protein
MFPLLLIVLGIIVILLGNRLAVLGAAVGALLGATLLRLIPGSSELWIELLVVGGLAVLGFFAAGFAKGIIDIVILVLGALAGAAIVLGFMDLFSVQSGMLYWLMAVVGAVLGALLIRRGRRGSKDWGMIILASLVGAMLVTRGLTIWLPSLQGALSTLIVVVLAAAGIAYQGGILNREEKSSPAVAPAPAAKPAAVPPPPAVTPDVPKTTDASAEESDNKS